MDLVALCDMWGLNCHLADFSFGRIFSCWSVVPNHPYPNIAKCLWYWLYQWKTVKMVGNSAIYPFYSWSIDLLWIATESWQVACKYLISFPRYNTLNIEIGIPKYLQLCVEASFSQIQSYSYLAISTCYYYQYN